MNFLAHLFLAGRDPGLVVGNILEDYIRGNIENSQNSILPEMVKKGIQQHRFIDTITDTDLSVKECKKIFYADFSKYSGVIVDVLFDHFLILNWSQYTDEPFLDFRKRIHMALDSFEEFQPEKMQLFVQSMKQYDWLKNFEFDWGLHRAFMNLNTKINNPEIDLTACLDIFYANHEILNQHFNTFFKKLKQFCDDYISHSGNE